VHARGGRISDRAAFYSGGAQGCTDDPALADAPR